MPATASGNGSDEPCTVQHSEVRPTLLYTEKVSLHYESHGGGVVQWLMGRGLLTPQQMILNRSNGSVSLTWFGQTPWQQPVSKSHEAACTRFKS